MILRHPAHVLPHHAMTQPSRHLRRDRSSSSFALALVSPLHCAPHHNSNAASNTDARIYPEAVQQHAAQCALVQLVQLPRVLRVADEGGVSGYPGMSSLHPPIPSHNSCPRSHHIVPLTATDWNLHPYTERKRPQSPSHALQPSRAR